MNIKLNESGNEKQPDILQINLPSLIIVRLGDFLFTSSLERTRTIDDVYNAGLIEETVVAVSL
jgi:hypothetical protein